MEIANVFETTNKLCFPWTWWRECEPFVETDVSSKKSHT